MSATRTEVCKSSEVVEKIQPLIDSGWAIRIIQSSAVSTTFVDGFSSSTETSFTFVLEYIKGIPFNGSLEPDDYEMGN